MPAAIAIPAIATAVAGGAAASASIYGAHAAGKANTKASELEASYNDKALAAAKEQQDYERQQETGRLGREAEQQQYTRAQDAAQIAREQEIQGYTQQTGEEQRDYGRAQYGSYLTRLSPYATGGQSSLPRLNGLLANSPVSGGAGGGGSVLMRAPNGQTQPVPADQVDHFLSRGAQRVN